MLDTYLALVGNQFEAALCTLNDCIDLCPDSLWQGSVVNNPYSQTVFHTLFFTDWYLCVREQDFRDQAYHAEHAELFGDYEQAEDRRPTSRYDKPPLSDYLGFCRNKARRTLAAETEETLAGASGFSWRDCTRAELHVYNVRHVVHHAAQLTMRLRLDAQIDVPWTSHGWRES